MTIEIPRRVFRKLSRRRFLSAGAGAVGVMAMPNLSRAADRPQIAHGVQSGDIGTEGGMVWARADRPSQMLVEVATTESFRNARVLPPIAALPESDFTAKMLLENLPAGQDIFYRVSFRDLSHINISSEPAGSAPRRATGATSVSSGAAMSPDKAGASIRTTAACSPSPPCASTSRIS
jgi:alkaline phosphatase D